MSVLGSRRFLEAPLGIVASGARQCLPAGEGSSSPKQCLDARALLAIVSAGLPLLSCSWRLRKVGVGPSRGLTSECPTTLVVQTIMCQIQRPFLAPFNLLCCWCSQYVTETEQEQDAKSL